MSLGDEIRGHLPFLRRYARALTGSQQHGDNFVHTTLEVIVAAPDEFSAGHSTRIDLYRNFHRIWESAYIDDGEGDDDGEDPFVHAANQRLSATIQVIQTHALALHTSPSHGHHPPVASDAKFAASARLESGTTTRFASRLTGLSRLK